MLTKWVDCDIGWAKPCNEASNWLWIYSRNIVLVHHPACWKVLSCVCWCIDPWWPMLATNGIQSIHSFECKFMMLLFSGYITQNSPVLISMHFHIEQASACSSPGGHPGGRWPHPVCSHWFTSCLPPKTKRCWFSSQLCPCQCNFQHGKAWYSTCCRKSCDKKSISNAPQKVTTMTQTTLHFWGWQHNYPNQCMHIMCIFLPMTQMQCSTTPAPFRTLQQMPPGNLWTQWNNQLLISMPSNARLSIANWRSRHC